MNRRSRSAEISSCSDNDDEYEEPTKRHKSGLNCGGCSRAFITFVLSNALEYTMALMVSLQEAEERPILCLPFPQKEVASWLSKAGNQCLQHVAYQELLGGGLYDPKNVRTYWKHPKQFYTWWKNNIERKVKFHKIKAMAKAFKDNGVYTDRRCAYSKITSVFADNIRSHCEKYVNANGGKIVQLPIPSIFRDLNRTEPPSQSGVTKFLKRIPASFTPLMSKYASTSSFTTCTTIESPVSEQSKEVKTGGGQDEDDDDNESSEMINPVDMYPFEKLTNVKSAPLLKTPGRRGRKPLHPPRPLLCVTPPENDFGEYTEFVKNIPVTTPTLGFSSIALTHAPRTMSRSENHRGVMMNPTYPLFEACFQPIDCPDVPDNCSDDMACKGWEDLCLEEFLI